MKRITALLIHPIVLSTEGRSARWVIKFPKGTKMTQCREQEKKKLPSFIYILREILNLILFDHMTYQKEN